MQINIYYLCGIPCRWIVHRVQCVWPGTVHHFYWSSWSWTLVQRSDYKKYSYVLIAPHSAIDLPAVIRYLLCCYTLKGHLEFVLDVQVVVQPLQLMVSGSHDQSPASPVFSPHQEPNTKHSPTSFNVELLCEYCLDVDLSNKRRRVSLA